MAHRFDQIETFKYITETNAPIYRSIMRFFFDKHNRYDNYISSNELYHWLRDNQYVNEDYKEDQLNLHLNQLVKWDCLRSKQDRKGGFTIEEFVKKRLLYKITNFGKEIESLLVRYDELDEAIVGSLDGIQFKKILKHLRTLNDNHPSKLSNEKTYEIWKDVIRTFQSLNTNASSYLSHIQSIETEELMQSDFFLEFKSKFVQYLGKFILELRQSKHRIISELKKIDEQHVQAYIKKIIDFNKDIQIMNDDYDSTKHEKTLNRHWRQLEFWFLGVTDEESDVKNLEFRTNEAIQLITRYANRLTDIKKQSQSRKSDYQSLSKWFSEIDSIDEAHQLSAAVFGARHSRSFLVKDANPYNKESEVWDDNHQTYETPNRSNRGPKGRRKSTQLTNNTEDKKEHIQQLIKQRKMQEEKINDLIIDGKITLSKQGLIEPFVRKTLLNWIARSFDPSKKTSGKLVRSELGKRYRVKKVSNQTISLYCTDGILKMPDLEIVFDEVSK